jgi:hypothetical protein
MIKPINRPEHSICFGVVRRSLMVIGPILTVLVGPSVKKTILPEPGWSAPACSRHRPRQAETWCGLARPPLQWVFSGKVIKPLGESADDAPFCESVQSDVNSLTAAKFQKIDWYKDYAWTAFFDRGHNL